MSRTFRILTAVLLAGGVAAGIGPARAETADPNVRRSLAAVRSATARYHDVDQAVADGYVAVGHCVPGTGLHYVHPGRMSDPAIVTTAPEILVYEPRPNGKPRLVAVEWWAVDRDQDLATDAGRPSLFGVPFDGPMVGHGPGMPVHFDLHAWIWKHNPAGTFVASNPNSTC